MDKNKCAIIGCGNVGAAIAYTFAIKNSFSEIVLIDKDKEKADGEAMDISHCMPFTKPFSIYSGDYSDTKSCSIIIITAGAAQTNGETRLDLANKNIVIFKDIIENISKYNRDCILIVVSNPVDILTYAAYKFSGFNKSKIIGSGTILDTARYKFALGEHLNVDSRNTHAMIIGEHGDSELAVLSKANIVGLNLKEFCHRCQNCEDCTHIKEILPKVKSSAYEIISKKGSTCYGIAMAVQKLVEGILGDEDCILTVSAVAEGEYGIKNTAIGLPCIINSSGISKILELPLSKKEEVDLINSANTLREVTENYNFT